MVDVTSRFILKLKLPDMVIVEVTSGLILKLKLPDMVMVDVTSRLILKLKLPDMVMVAIHGGKPEQESKPNETEHGCKIKIKKC